MQIGQTIYLDYQASTPVDPRVLPVMMAYYSQDFANPHSSDHALGWRANAAVERAAEQVAGAVGADANEIVFTSGATEANNLAILGAAARAPMQRRRILVSTIEHKCVLAAAAAAAQHGCTVEKVAVGPNGVVDLTDLERRLGSDVLLVSIMAVNNEIGTVQPVREVARLARRVGAFVHSDAVQALTAIDLDVTSLDVDLLSLSAHKVYGPKGIGALFVRRDVAGAIEPQIHGGGQQMGLRSGTVPVPLCVGFGRAVELLNEEPQAEERARIAHFRDLLESSLCGLGSFIRSNVSADTQRHPGNLSLRFEGMDARDLLAALQPQVAASTGSACTSGVPEPSHVLRAIGLTASQADSSIRFSLGRFTTLEQIDESVDAVRSALEHLQTDIMVG